MVYCTLFDSNYLDRGLVTIDSLSKVDQAAKVYVLCMDARCFDIMGKIGHPNVALININNFEDEELLSVKSSRSRGEYSWTCTSKLIKYVLFNFNEERCTYIDADLCFYANPTVLIDEMEEAHCTVQVIPHRFPPNKRGKQREIESGRNCVQFNTFSKEENSIKLLDTWINQCIEECSVESVGDQKYTDPWTELDYVNTSINGGAGVAPWNITRYLLVDKEKKIIKDRYTGKCFSLIFYHFQNLTFPDDNIGFVLPFQEYWILDNDFVRTLYSDYLRDLFEKREMLKNRFNFFPIIRTYITSEKRQLNLVERILRFAKLPISQKIDGISGKIRKYVRRKVMYISFPTDKSEEK